MQRLLAITWLTWKAALRFRLFWVLAVLLVGSVVLLPLVIKDDGTARGFSQILLTYTLSVVTALLGLSTLWLACGTLARDIEENQMQVVCVKPIGRWQVWLGKWLGLVTLDAVLLAVAGTCIFALMQWRAQKLPAAQQKILREEVMVARASLKEPEEDLETRVEQAFQEVTKNERLDPARAAYLKNVLRERFKVQVVKPNQARRWQMGLGPLRSSLRNETLFARIKFFAATTNALGTYYLTIRAGPPEAPQRQRIDATFADNAFHEVRIAPGLWDDSGTLTIDVENHSGVALLIPNEEGFELLYRESSFAVNFVRGLLIILCWLGLLAALGLAAASFLSFPVATFVSASLLLIALSSGTLSSAVEAGTIMGVNEESGEKGKSVLDHVLIPAFKGLLRVFKLVEGFSPIDALSTGRSVEWSTVALAFAQIVLLLGGLLALGGIALFARRELAATTAHT